MREPLATGSYRGSNQLGAFQALWLQSEFTENVHILLRVLGNVLRTALWISKCLDLIAQTFQSKVIVRSEVTTLSAALRIRHRLSPRKFCETIKVKLRSEHRGGYDNHVRVHDAFRRQRSHICNSFYDDSLQGTLFRKFFNFSRPLPHEL